MAKQTMQEKLNALLESHRTAIRVKCRMQLPLAGGLPATENGLRYFVKSHMGIPEDSDEFESVLEKVQEEIGARDTTSEEGELSTEHIYSLNVIRRSQHGPYVMEHMLKALLKQAASRIGVFQKNRGSKGDLAEMGSVLAIEDSLQNPDRPWEVYLRNGVGAAKTHFDIVQGCPSGPKGKKSIQTHTEVTDEGTRFAFELRFGKGKITKDLAMHIIAASTQIGLGSCLSLPYGKFIVEDLEFVGKESSDTDEEDDA